MTIRCDKAMKEKKEEAAKKHRSAEQWQCRGECDRCICGLKKNEDGTWRHV